MRDNPDLARLCEQFASYVLEQRSHMREGESRKGNRCAKRYTAIAGELLAAGTAGELAFSTLLAHNEADVKVLAACFLLPHRTSEALTLLRKESLGVGLAAYGAQLTLERWKTNADGLSEK